MEGIDINNITPEQNKFIINYKRINSRLESLTRDMNLIQLETKELISELEELRKQEIKTFKNGNNKT